jgi:hypothetical protein
MGYADESKLSIKPCASQRMSVTIAGGWWKVGSVKTNLS